MRRIASLFVFATLAATPALAAVPVPVAGFDSIQLHGGGEIILRPGPVQRVMLISGSRQFTTFATERNGRLTISACNSQCPRNYKLRIEIQSPTVPAVAINGGGSIVASRGFARQHQVSAAINGGGAIDVRAVPARDVAAAVNGGGLIRTGASATLSVAVKGGGEVRYSGDPQLSTAILGGGTVSRN